MNVEKFVKEIKEKRDQDRYLSERVNVSYIPYETKIARCEQIINICSYVEIDGHKIYRVNSPIKFVLTTLTLINEYTDIDIDFSDESFLKDFNLLDENILIDKLIGALPEHEYKTWMRVLQMIDGDKQENERSLTAFFDTKMNAIEKMLSETVNAFSEIEAEETNNN